MEEIKVCHLLSTLNPGGAEYVTLRLIKNSSKNISHSVCYFQGSRDQAHYLYDEFEEAGANVHYCKSRILYDPRGLYKLLTVALEEEFDVIHNHVILTHPIGRIIGKISRVDTIISNHDGVITKYRPHFRILERITRWCDDTTVAYSDGVKESYSDQWTIIYNGIDVAEFRLELSQIDDKVKNDIRNQLGISQDDHLFLNIARYVDQKSQKTAIRAFKEVASKRKDAHLVLVGYGPLEENLRALANDLCISNSVTVTGRVTDLKPYYATADTFVLTYAPYIRDWGIVSLEAMAAGLPIVATRTENMNMIVKEGQTGYLVEPDNHVEMADAIVQLCDSGRQEEFGSAGLNMVKESFDIKKTVEQYEKLYLKHQSSRS